MSGFLVDLRYNESNNIRVSQKWRFLPNSNIDVSHNKFKCYLPKKLSLVFGVWDTLNDILHHSLGCLEPMIVESNNCNKLTFSEKSPVCCGKKFSTTTKQTDVLPKTPFFWQAAFDNNYILQSTSLFIKLKWALTTPYPTLSTVSLPIYD